MRTFSLLPVFTAFVLLIIPAAAKAETGTKADIGAPAPDFTLTDSSGTEHSLSDFLGKTVVLEWTNHECPYVKKHYESGNMQQLQKQATDKGVIWLSIVSSAEGKQGYTTPEESQMLIEKQNINATARLHDPSGEVGRLYGAKTTPHMYVINSEGTLVYAGAIDDNPSPNPAVIENSENYVLAALNSLEKNEPIATSMTKPYGCSVKYEAF